MKRSRLKKRTRRIGAIHKDGYKTEFFYTTDTRKEWAKKNPDYWVLRSR